MLVLVVQRVGNCIHRGKAVHWKNQPYTLHSMAISFSETRSFCIAPRIENSELGEIGRWASISFSGYPLYACSETTIARERMRTIEPDPGFSGSGIWFCPEAESVGRWVTADRKTRWLWWQDRHQASPFVFQGFTDGNILTCRAWWLTWFRGEKIILTLCAQCRTETSKQTRLDYFVIARLK